MAVGTPPPANTALGRARFANQTPHPITLKGGGEPYTDAETREAAAAAEDAAAAPPTPGGASSAAAKRPPRGVLQLRSGSTLEHLCKVYQLTARRHALQKIVQLSYSQRDSDLANAVVQECRGLILEEGSWNVVCCGPLPNSSTPTSPKRPRPSRPSVGAPPRSTKSATARS